MENAPKLIILKCENRIDVTDAAVFILQIQYECTRMRSDCRFMYTVLQYARCARIDLFAGYACRIKIETAGNTQSKYGSLKCVCLFSTHACEALSSRQNQRPLFLY